MTSQADFDELRDIVAAEIARTRVPGVAVGLLRDGEEFTAGFGVTNVNHPLPVDGDTLFQIGSITKTFTATVAMRLVEEGRLDLDAPVRRWLPELQLADPDVAACVTPRHLLTHTAGFVGDYFSDTGRGDDALARYVTELADLEQLTPPGIVYSYCNSGFSLLGRVIEVITGETFEKASQRLALAPLGLERSFLFPEDAMTHRFAVGHANVQNNPVVLQPWQLTRSATPAGGIIASVRELLRYASLQLRDGRSPSGERLLSHESLQAMRQPLVPSTGLPDRSVGLAWNVAPSNINHSGGTLGQRAFLMVCPDHAIALAGLTNARAGDRVMAAAARWVSANLLKLPKPPETPPIVADDGLLDACVGLYRAPTRNIEIGRLGDALVFREIPLGGFPTKDSPEPPGPPPPPIRVGFYAEGRLVGLDPPYTELRAEILRGDDGSVNWLRFFSRIHKHVQ
ncbi:MAG: beta-lactamase family protein [Chloroflexi bacterium]|nr:beta-lactamase family protein [Chloroflexota bacterium]